MTKIAPSILSGDFARLGQTVADATAWGADYIHYDVMDGVFVPNLTFGMPMLRAIRPYTSLPIDAHLMMVHPERYVEEFCLSGADIITFHPEICDDISGALATIHHHGKKGGLVLNPDKDPSLLLPYLDQVDIVLLMGVYPGFGGQRFIPEVLQKIKTVRALIDASGRAIELEVDGGVTLDNASALVAAGIDVVVAGSCVFGHSSPATAIAALRQNR